MEEKKEMEAIFDSEKKKALGDLAESMVKAGVKKAIIALRNRCDVAEKNNVAQFPFITEAISYTRSAINDFDVSDANDLLVDALSLLYRSIRDLELPNEDKSKTRDKNPRIDAGFKLLKLPKDVPGWLTIDLLLDC